MGIRLVATTMPHDEILRYKVTSNGKQINGCMWLDTDEGIAECVFLSKNRALLGYDGYVYREHTYYLHTFEVWKDDVMIAQV